MSDTGWFPAVNAKGKRRMHGDMSLFELRLRGTKDGFVRAFIDDGADDAGQPNQKRQHLLRKMTAVDSDGVPLFFVDEQVAKGPKFVSTGAGINVPVQVLDDRIRAAQVRYMGERAANEQRADMEVRNREAAHAEAKEAAAGGSELRSKPKPRSRKAAPDGDG